MATVRLQQLTRKFPDGSVALAGLTLDIKHGEFLVLVGPSGCGKTTALRLIAGLDAPTSGRIVVGEEDVTDLPPGSRDVAMVFQNYALYPHFTVAENIAFPLKMRRVPAGEQQRQVREVAETLGIGELLARKPAQLSGGQRQRVALARALVRQPAVFLFDEPLSNLDAQVRASTRAELVRLHRQLGATMIFVTHDQVEAMSMAQRMAVLNKGRLEQCAAPLEVYRTPATRFTAQFVGSPSINTFDGTIEGKGSRQLFVGAVQVPVTAPPGSGTLAVRPEHLHIVPPGDGTFPVRVALVEPLGAECIVHALLGDNTEVRVRVPGLPTVATGDTVHLRIDHEAALVFDAEGRLEGRGRRP